METANERNEPAGEAEDQMRGGVQTADKENAEAGAGTKNGGDGLRAAAKGVKPRTLAIDIGGSGIKAAVLDANGEPVTERMRVPTPRPATPEAIIGAIAQLAAAQGAFERISAGFPGVVKKGVVYTAKNLSVEWEGFNLARTLREKLNRPARVANDADVQGLGVIRGRGTELVITLGTGFGSSLFIEGMLVPNVQLSRQSFRKGGTFEDRLGHAALEKAGKKKWNRRLGRAIDHLAITFNYSALYIGGGNARHVTLKLPRNARIISNEEGVLGGIALWRDARKACGNPEPRARSR